MFKRFASLAHSDQFAYAFDSQAWDAKSPIDCNFRQYFTYGDGLTAHSDNWSIQIEFMADYLASLAEAMLADEELAMELAHKFSRRPSVKQIEFAASIVYKEAAPQDWLKSRRWFSVKEMKITKSPAKEHDKRYTEVSSVHDGSPDSIFRILVSEYADGLEKYQDAEAIRDWVLEQDGMYMGMAAEFLKWFDDREKARALRDAFDACKQITESYRLRHSTMAHLANYKRSIERAKETPIVAEQIGGAA